jgi:serine/threonine protein phosphatase PrpC
MLSFRAAALSDIGRVRRNNEDRYLLDEARKVFGVADGVGGLPGGAQAAQSAVDTVVSGLLEIHSTTEPDLVSVVHATNRSVIALGQQLSPGMGIGTTLTFGCLCEEGLRIAHVGDSRCYVARNGKFVRLTEDHSVENEARLRRARGEVVYYHEANRNALTRCIGQPTPPDVDIITFALARGDRYLFCTDGVTRLIPDSELGSLVMKHSQPKEALEEIIGLAIRRGGPDNATGVMVYVDSV